MTHSPDPRARAQAAYEAWIENGASVPDFLLAFVESERKIAAEAAADSTLEEQAAKAYEDWLIDIGPDDHPSDVVASFARDSLAAKDAEIAALRGEITQKNELLALSGRVNNKLMTSAAVFAVTALRAALVKEEGEEP